ncbi:MAG: 50S ribosomal protein L28 [Treponema sp.]|nr:50S ribosomal protein L28 [Spirochaetia bacterium]MDY2840801.1 50S ribosomal protein L28 [Treponema sp.]MDY5123785.1 50S ribosomal protein L28 [Treponema sp.]
MSRMCDVCGKGVMSGNKVSKSYNHTRRTWRPNLHSVKATLPNGSVRTLKVCSGCLSANFIEKKVRVPKTETPANN